MHYLVTITPTYDAANALDAAPGGPGPLFAWMAEHYRPVAFWVAAGERSASWIIEISEGAQLHELVHIAARKGATTPVLTPIILGEDAQKTIPAAMAVAAQAP